MSFGSIRSTLALVFGLSLSSATPALADVPASFPVGDDKAVFVDMEKLAASLTFDVQNRTVHARALVRFRTEEEGFPVVDLAPNVTAVRLNGEVLAPSLFERISAPGKATQLRVLKQALPAGGDHELALEYELLPGDTTFRDGTAALGFFMNDLRGSGNEQRYLERWLPANLEYDSFAISLEAKVIGTGKSHTLFANGQLVTLGTNHWKVDFPSYFTASSPYFHLTARAMNVRTFEVEGMAADIPVTLYEQKGWFGLPSQGKNLADAESVIRKTLAELESTYGAYPHGSLVVYLTDGGGGMEYSGATMTSLWALEHEITHSWFARGVMPANGNAGWIDEAVASWRDDNYPRHCNTYPRAAVNLAGFSSYNRGTPMEAYTEGARLIGELDCAFQSQGGMKALLRDLFAEKARQVITTPLFQEFLERVTASDLSSTFTRYVYGQKSAAAFESEPFQPSVSRAPMAPQPSRHPRPYSPEEIQKFQ